MEILRFKQKVREMVIWEWQLFWTCNLIFIGSVWRRHFIVKFLWFSLGAQNSFTFLQGLQRGIDYLCLFMSGNVYISVTYLNIFNFSYISCPIIYVLYLIAIHSVNYLWKFELTASLSIWNWPRFLGGWTLVSA